MVWWPCAKGQYRLLNIFHNKDSTQGRHEPGRMSQPEQGRMSQPEQAGCHSLDSSLTERVSTGGLRGSEDLFSGVDITGGYCYGNAGDNPDSLEQTFAPSSTARSASRCICLGSGPTSDIGREELDGSATGRGFGMFMQNTGREVN
jgi:hypothetical protein